MRFRLRTLLVIMTLAAIVTIAFGVNAFWGIWTYLACFSLFMMTWRTGVACHQYDAHAPAYQNEGAPLRILLVNGAIGLLAAIIFCGSCTTTALTTHLSLGLPIMTTKEKMDAFALAVNLELVFALIVGTVAALWCYWLSWPSREK